ncbi:hypothetical protein D3C85_792880 [compost metagenome]
MLRAVLRTPRAQQLITRLLRGLQPGIQQAEQFLLQRPHLSLAVARRIGVVIQQRHTVSTQVHFQGQIFHRAGAQAQGTRRAVAEALRSIERHDIDQRAEQALLAADPAEVAAQRFIAVMLILAAAAAQLADALRSFEQVRLIAQIEAQRRNVHLHAGHVEGSRTHAVHHHQAEHLGGAAADLAQLR